MYIPLTDWLIRDFAPGEGSAAEISSSRDDQLWLAAQAPGDVHDVLRRNGRIADPFDDRAEEAARWVEDREWWWRTAFDCPAPQGDERVLLEFDGLDTFATIWLNRQEIGRSSNMFHGVTIDVTDALDPRGNQLLVRFDPTALHVADKMVPSWSSPDSANADAKRNAIRKAQFGWGWDWGPRLPTIGIWRGVRLRHVRHATLTVPMLHTLSLAADHATALCRIEVAARMLTEAADLRAHARVVAPDGASVFDADVALSADGAGAIGTVDFTIDAPQLWWTHDLGAQSLYRLEVSLFAGADRVDTQQVDIGIRTIALDTSPDPDEPGASFFRFVLNGRPTFAKGACWIPADSLVARITPEHYHMLLEQSAAANMNMLRIWGGGIYEHEAFYQGCDRLGILVWQDFMFACAPYPDDDPAFNASVEAEVRYQVERLRHHPSIALWCGNNENQFIQSMIDHATGKAHPLPGAAFYDELIPAITGALDPTRPYWPGSPFGGDHANSMKQGDVHNWTVWHGLYPVPDNEPVGALDLSPAGVDYRRYAIDMGRFISEFGIHAAPVMESLARQMPGDELVIRSAAMLHRNKDHPTYKGDNMMVTVTGLPETIGQYVDFSQITQAEGLKFGIEHFRRRMPHCSGTLIWQLNDCWPGISWSVIDYYGFAKAGYHYVRRVYAPVLASFKILDDGAVELWITNDRDAAATGRCTVALATFGAGSLWSETVEFSVPANSSRPVWLARADRIAAAPDRVLTVRSADDLFPGNRIFFAAIKDLERPSGLSPRVEIAAGDADELIVTIEAPAAYLYFVQLHTPYETTRYSDNFFDLLPGERRTIAVRDASGRLRAGDVTVRSC